MRIFTVVEKFVRFYLNLLKTKLSYTNKFNRNTRDEFFGWCVHKYYSFHDTIHPLVFHGRVADGVLVRGA